MYNGLFQLFYIASGKTLSITNLLNIMFMAQSDPLTYPLLIYYYYYLSHYWFYLAVSNKIFNFNQCYFNAIQAILLHRDHIDNIFWFDTH